MAHLHNECGGILWLWCEKCGEWVQEIDYCSYSCPEHRAKIANADKAAALAHDMQALQIENELLRMKLSWYEKTEAVFNPKIDEMKEILKRAFSDKELKEMFGE